jgi:hypothetical protein
MRGKGKILLSLHSERYPLTFRNLFTIIVASLKDVFQERFFLIRLTLVFIYLFGFVTESKGVLMYRIHTWRPYAFSVCIFFSISWIFLLVFRYYIYFPGMGLVLQIVSILIYSIITSAIAILVIDGVLYIVFVAVTFLLTAILGLRIPVD